MTPLCRSQMSTIQKFEHVLTLSQEQQNTITSEEALAAANARMKKQRSMTVPITENLVALMFVSWADLTQDQRQVLTSLMARRNRPLADYRIQELREVYLEVFCATRTSVENPLLAPSGNAGRKTLLVPDKGYLDTYEGFWVEDEEDGAEGFLELDEDTFWVFDDDSAAWFQRRFQGRKMRRGKGGGKRKGKGKGKGRGGRCFFKKKKGRSHLTGPMLGKHGIGKIKAGMKIGLGKNKLKNPMLPKDKERKARKAKGKGS